MTQRDFSKAHVREVQATAFEDQRLREIDEDFVLCEHCLQEMRQGTGMRRIGKRASPSGRSGYVHDPLTCTNAFLQHVNDDDYAREVLEAETRNAEQEDKRDEAWESWGEGLVTPAIEQDLTDEQVAFLAVMFRPRREAP